MKTCWRTNIYWISLRSSFLFVHCENYWLLLVHCSSSNVFFKIDKRPFEYDLHVHKNLHVLECRWDHFNSFGAWRTWPRSSPFSTRAPKTGMLRQQRAIRIVWHITIPIRYGWLLNCNLFLSYVFTLTAWKIAIRTAQQRLLLKVQTQ